MQGKQTNLVYTLSLPGRQFVTLLFPAQRFSWSPICYRLQFVVENTEEKGRKSSFVLRNETFAAGGEERNEENTRDNEEK